MAELPPPENVLNHLKYCKKRIAQTTEQSFLHYVHFAVLPAVFET